jgi:hypothetical protein
MASATHTSRKRPVPTIDDLIDRAEGIRKGTAVSYSHDDVMTRIARKREEAAKRFQS